jgi:predicted ester cyclase
METVPTSMDRVARIRRMLEEGSDEHDLFSPDFVNRAPWDLAVQRRENSPAAKFDAERVFSDLRMTVEKAEEVEDTVIIHWRMHGKWSGALPFAPGIPPTGKEVEFTGTHVYRFSGNQIVEKDGEFDVKAASKALLGGLNITCGSEDCVDVVQALSRSATVPTRVGEPA